MSYVVGDATDPLKVDELAAPLPGTEGQLTLVAVDAYGNRLTNTSVGRCRLTLSNLSSNRREISA
jgi:hypothetical protein